jgi:transposase
MLPATSRDETERPQHRVVLEWRRLQAWHLKQLGWKHCDIAVALNASEGAVSRWVTAARAGGPGALGAKPQSGAPRRLTDDDYRKLETLLSAGPMAHGWANELWTAARIARVIEKEFGVKYHHAHVSRILKERLNWTCQRPAQHHKDRDDKAITRWVKEDFPVIAAAAVARGAWTVFIDETGFMLVPTIRRTYAPRGQTPVHRIGDPHGRISGAGAIAISPGRDRIRLRYALLADQVNFRGPSIVQFLRDLQSELRGPMTVIWDQIPIHECAQITEFLAAQRDVIAEPFPPYAPELNPADGIWRYIKYGRLANYTPYEMDELRGKVVEELDRLRDSPDLLKSFVRFAKLPIEL